MRLYILLLLTVYINTNIYSQIKPKITTNQISNLLVDSTRLENDSILVYYQNGIVIGRDTISGTGGSVGGVTGSGTTNYLTKFTDATTLGNSMVYESGDTLVVPKFLNVDTATLYVDAVNNRVGIGINNPTVSLQVNKQIIAGNVDPNDYDNVTTNPGFHIGVVDPTAGSRAMNLVHYGGTTPSAAALFRLRRSRGTSIGDYTKVENGDVLGYFEWLYSNGTTWGGGGGFTMNIDGATGTGDFPTRISFYTTTDGTASETEKMRLNNAGQLLIGYTASQGATYKLQVQDSVYVGGNVSANAYTTRSDIRLKENITQYNNGLNDVLNLNPVYFYQKEFPTKQRLGFIAQDVRDIIPQAITDDEQNDYLGIEYSALIPVLTKAIQEQQQIIETQQQEIETLKTQYNDLLQRIINLENK